jgi:1-acyl-sn-glycerol-3-phosphate acyltransferase
MRTLILLIFIVIVAVLFIPLIFLCYVLRCSQPIFFIGKRILRIARVILGIRLDVSGIEGIEKKKAYIFMSNHLSIIDGPLLFMIIPQYLRVILKKEAFRIPIIAQAMRQIGFIPVDRKRLKGGKESIDRASRMIREKGFSFLIFPEGTRSRDGELQPFKRGGVFLALNSHVDILPVTIKGTYKLMPKGSFFIKKGKVGVAFHQPVSVEGFDNQSLSLLVDKIRDIIKAGLDE